MYKMKDVPYKIYLEENEMPKKWHNVRAAMKEKPEPFIHPATGEACVKDDLLPVFCEELVNQEFNVSDEYIDIPDKILSFYKMFRPSPLVRAYCLEEALKTPAKIFYKFEGNNTSGSHKLNSAAAQV
jgi:tryptophan synthase beta chain